MLKEWSHVRTFGIGIWADVQNHLPLSFPSFFGSFSLSSLLPSFSLEWVTDLPQRILKRIKLLGPVGLPLLLSLACGWEGFLRFPASGGRLRMDSDSELYSRVLLCQRKPGMGGCSFTKVCSSGSLPNCQREPI